MTSFKLFSGYFCLVMKVPVESCHGGASQQAKLPNVASTISTYLSSFPLNLPVPPVTLIILKPLSFKIPQALELLAPDWQMI